MTFTKPVWVICDAVNNLPTTSDKGMVNCFESIEAARASLLRNNAVGFVIKEGFLTNNVDDIPEQLKPTPTTQ